VTWLSENPWPLAGTFGVVALVCLIALRITQQGKFLVWAGGALGLALLVIVIEQLWVTDAERVEAVVYDLGRAVRRSDADAVLAHLTPDVTLTQQGSTLGGEQLSLVRKVFPKADPDTTNLARSAIRLTLKNAQFDFLSISHLEASVGKLSRRGKADFRVTTSGSFESSGIHFNFATDASGTDWSLGFREENGRWLVDSITATRLPRGWRLPLGEGRP
jgi:hypothetical protein